MVARGSSTDDPTKTDQYGHWLSCGFHPVVSAATPIVAEPPSVEGPSSRTLAEVTFDDPPLDVGSLLAQAAAVIDTIAMAATTRIHACGRECPVKGSTSCVHGWLAPMLGIACRPVIDGAHWNRMHGRPHRGNPYPWFAVDVGLARDGREVLSLLA